MSYTDLLFTNKHAGGNTTIQSSAKTAVKVWLQVATTAANDRLCAPDRT